MPSLPIRVEDLLVEIRNNQLVRKGSIPGPDLDLKMQPVFNGVGSWSVTLPAEHKKVPLLRAPGAGIIVTNLQTGEIIMSGTASKPSKKATASDPKGMVTIAGLDDNRLVFDGLSVPTPSVADFGAQTTAHDVRTGNAESLMRQYISANIATGAPSGRKAGSIRQYLTIEAANTNLGATLTKRPRFQKLNELLAEISAESGINLGWRIVQVGLNLEFQVYQPTDRTAFIRLDVANGTLSDQSVEFAPPEVTRLAVAGQGDLEDRQIVQVTTTESLAAEAEWGLIIEEFMDRRDTDVTAELVSAGQGDLAERGFTKVAVKASPSNDQTMVFMKDFFLGDKVTVVIDGQEPKSWVTEAAIVVNSSGIFTAVAIGDIADFDSQSALRGQVNDNTRRIGALERNIEIATRPYGFTQIAMLEASYRGNGPSKVYWLPSLTLSTETYEWESAYLPWGNRAVTMVWRGDRWAVLGHSGQSDMGKINFLPTGSIQSYGTATASLQYTEPRYQKTPAGIVQLSGLMQVKGWSPGEVIATLPPGFRPDFDNLYQVNVGDNPRVLNVRANGNIEVYGTWPSSYVSLDTIAFPAAGVATWTEIGSAGSGSAFANGFFAHPSTSTYGTPAFWKDPYDVVWFRGLVRAPSTPGADNTVMFTLPATHQSRGTSHVPVGSSNGSADQFGMVSAIQNGGVAWKLGSLGASYVSLARLTIVTAAAISNPLNWLAPVNLTNGWTNYGGTFNTFLVMRRADGMAMTEGLVRAGTVGALMMKIPPEMQPGRTAILAIARNNAVFGRIDNYGLRGSPDSVGGAGSFWGHTVETGWTSFDGIKWMVGE